MARVERPIDRRLTACRRIQEKNLIAALRGKVLDKVVFGKDEMALEDRVRQHTDNPQLERVAPIIHIRQRISQRFAQ